MKPYFLSKMKDKSKPNGGCDQKMYSLNTPKNISFYFSLAWHYREVDKTLKTTLMAKAKEIYAKHDFDIMTISKRFENKPPEGWNRGDSCIHLLKWIFGLDWEDRVKVYYI